LFYTLEKCGVGNDKHSTSPKEQRIRVYYARIRQSGKQVWQSPKTDVYSVAKAKLAGKISELRNASGTSRVQKKANPV